MNADDFYQPHKIPSDFKGLMPTGNNKNLNDLEWNKSGKIILKNRRLAILLLAPLRTLNKRNCHLIVKH